MIQILIKTTHYQYKCYTQSILKTHGTMGWTVRYSCISERDRWTFCGMSHDPMGPWDGMDSRTRASVEGQVDIPWNVPRSHGTVGWDGQ